MKHRWLLPPLLIVLLIIAGCQQQQSPVAPVNLTLAGPKSGVTGKTYEFTVSADPITVTQPLTFTWQASGQSPVISTGNLTSTASFAWPNNGPQTITVIVENGAGTFTKKFDFAVAIAVPDAPAEAVKLMADKQKDIKSEHLDVTLDLTLQLAGLDSSTDQTTAQMAAMFKNFKASAALNGDVDSAQNNFQLSGSADLGPFTAMLAQGADKLTFDLVKVGDTMYSRALGKDWSSSNVKSSGASASTSISATEASAQMAEILKKAAKAEKLGDESIDGADSYHYKVTLNPADLLTQFANIAKSADPSAKIDQAQLDQASQLLKDSTIEVDMWVGKADLLVRQEKIHLNFNIKNIPNQPGASALIDLSILAKITKINQPLTITAPK